MKFTTQLFSAGKTATGIEIPAKIVESFNAGKKPPVRITINGYTYRNTVAVMGGVYMVGVSAQHRKGANIAAGDTIEVTITLDTDPRVVEVPAELAELLKKNSAARQYFDSLSNSKKKGITLPITDAKTAETRNRRLEKAISLLNEGKL